MSDLVMCSLIYLGVGCMIWLVFDPAAYRDFVVQRHIDRTGARPPKALLVLSVMAAVVLWPKIVVMVLRAMRGAR